MELVSDYMREDTMRHALNELTRKTFFFDFEDWVTGGNLSTVVDILREIIFPIPLLRMEK